MKFPNRSTSILLTGLFFLITSCTFRLCPTYDGSFKKGHGEITDYKPSKSKSIGKIRTFKAKQTDLY